MTIKTGFVKIQSIILPFGKQLIPQFLYIGYKVWRPCSLPSTTVSSLEEKHTIALIVFESEMNRTVRIRINSLKHRRINNYSDGSALYECDIENSDNLSDESSFEHYDFNLKLYHHTNNKAVVSILESERLNGGRWNYEGAVELENQSFVYFTDLKAIDSQDDLRRIAMTNGEHKIGLAYDQEEYGVEILDVPKRDRDRLNDKITAYISPEIIDHQPMLYHDSSIRGEGVGQYWELLHQNIFRVPMQREGYIKVTAQNKNITEGDVNELIMPKTILAGCAFEQGCIRVVFNEEDGAGYNIEYEVGDIDPITRFLS